jgi:hypothetical protein
MDSRLLSLPSFTSNFDTYEPSPHRVEGSNGKTTTLIVTILHMMAPLGHPLYNSLDNSPYALCEPVKRRYPIVPYRAFTPLHFPRLL